MRKQKKTIRRKLYKRKTYKKKTYKRKNYKKKTYKRKNYKRIKQINQRGGRPRAVKAPPNAVNAPERSDPIDLIYILERRRPATVNKHVLNMYKFMEDYKKSTRIHRRNITFTIFSANKTLNNGSSDFDLLAVVRYVKTHKYTFRSSQHCFMFIYNISDRPNEEFKRDYIRKMGHFIIKGTISDLNKRYNIVINKGSGDSDVEKLETNKVISDKLRNKIFRYLIYGHVFSTNINYENSTEPLTRVGDALPELVEKDDEQTWVEKDDVAKKWGDLASIIEKFPETLRKLQRKLQESEVVVSTTPSHTSDEAREEARLKEARLKEELINETAARLKEEEEAKLKEARLKEEKCEDICAEQICIKNRDGSVNNCDHTKLTKCIKNCISINSR